MKAFIAFWKKDIINKLIVMTLLALLAGVIAFVSVVINMPQGKSLSQAFAGFLPGRATPTFDVSAYLIASTNTSPVKTPIPLTLPSLTAPIPTTATEAPTPTPTLAIPTPEPTGTSTQPPLAQLACIPNNPPETGRVVEIVDGNTIKVLINSKVYVVRYIGISVPPEVDPYGKASMLENAGLVFAKDIILIRDISDKDDRGRLLRYVMVGDTFVNLKLVKRGYASTIESSPDSACTQTFRQAEQSAGSGTPSVTPSP
jgi:endonuclease YncB( thermonuclease family)